MVPKGHGTTIGAKISGNATPQDLAGDTVFVQATSFFPWIGYLVAAIRVHRFWQSGGELVGIDDPATGRFRTGLDCF